MAAQRYWHRARTWKWAALSVAGSAVAAAFVAIPSGAQLDPAGGSSAPLGSADVIKPATSDPSDPVRVETTEAVAANPPEVPASTAPGAAAPAVPSRVVDAATTTSVVAAESEESVTAAHEASVPPEISPSTTIVPVAPPPAAAPRPTASTLLPPRSDAPHWEVIGTQALSRISFPWQEQLPGWTLQFLPGRAGLLGGTWTYEKRIEIYVRDYQDADDVAFTLAHELGHAVDVAMLSDADRETWRLTRGFGEDVPWWVASGATDFSSGAGDWAESFAVWQTGGWSHSKLGGQPSSGQLAMVANLAR